MEQTIKKIRDLTFIIVIYLYFVAWIYVHFYYQQFGISTSSIKIDYNSYLMYSYNVVTSPPFIFWLMVVVAVLVLRMLFLFLIAKFGGQPHRFTSLRAFYAYHSLLLRLGEFNKQYSFFLYLFFFIIVFPFLFWVARKVALDNYEEDRKSTKNLKTIQFIFRKGADLMSPAAVLDSTLSKTDLFYHDISLLKRDTSELLRLLGESDDCYIVLQQQPYDKTVDALPTGYVYYIDKKDVLISKIILRSL
ncbi:MAG: hypothetical protein EOO10_03760 [Chitinophagaceae bacterium]|nr:MAG: hypothetical protein EOO10_03760 [Chitinophagaceae bacterium]